MCVYMCIHRHTFQRVVRPCRGQRTSPAQSESPTVPVEGGHFPGVDVGSPKSDLPWRRLRSTNLPLAQSGSDCAGEVLCPRRAVKSVACRSKLVGIRPLQISNAAWCPRIVPLGIPIPFPTL